MRVMKIRRKSMAYVPIDIYVWVYEVYSKIGSNF